MRLPLFLLCYLAFAPTMLAQETCVVVSNNGLKLRETPDRNGRVLAVAPFGAQVRVLKTQIKRDGQRFIGQQDTIGDLNRCEWGDTPHVGYWWKVRFASKTGYMFSGFLADSTLLGLPPKRLQEISHDFRLRNTEGNGCSTNHPEFDPAWNWYGLFRAGDAKYSLKKVSVSYAVSDGTLPDGSSYDLVPKSLVTRIDADTCPMFLIGTRGTLPERVGFDGTELHETQHLEDGWTFNPDVLKKHGLDWKLPSTSYEEGTMYLVGPNGVRQEIEAKFRPNYIVWIGDLDGDGKRDYIFGRDSETGFRTLYLSSKAKKGEVARLVAALWSWYCC